MQMQEPNATRQAAGFGAPVVEPERSHSLRSWVGISPASGCPSRSRAAALPIPLSLAPRNSGVLCTHSGQSLVGAPHRTAAPGGQSVAVSAQRFSAVAYRAQTISKKRAHWYAWPKRNNTAMPNTSFERTRHGSPLQAFISFWALRVLPRCASQLER